MNWRYPFEQVSREMGWGPCPQDYTQSRWAWWFDDHFALIMLGFMATGVIFPIILSFF